MQISQNKVVTPVIITLETDEELTELINFLSEQVLIKHSFVYQLWDELKDRKISYFR